MQNEDTKITQFNFQEIAVSEAIFIEGIPYFTRRAIGEWLEYKDPQNGIDAIISRKSSIDSYSVPVNLSGTDGKNYETKVYHPIGFLLIVMESDQPKATTMKEQVASFVWEYGRSNVTPKDRIQLGNQRINLLGKLNTCTNTFVREGLYDQLTEVTLALGLPLPDKVLLNNSDPRQLMLNQ